PLRCLRSFPTRRSSDLGALFLYWTVVLVSGPGLPLGIGALSFLPPVSQQKLPVDYILIERLPIGICGEREEYLRHLDNLSLIQGDRKSTRLNSSHRTIS